MINICFADCMPIQGTSASAAIVLIYVCRSLPVSAPQGMNFYFFILNVCANAFFGSYTSNP